MASLGARAARNQEARKRLKAALAGISRRLGVPVPDEPRRMRDAALQPIVELERFADFAESVLGAIEALAAGQEAPAGYDALTVKMLREVIAERGLEVPNNAKKAGLVAALEDADAKAQADEDAARAEESTNEPDGDGESDDAGDGLDQPEEDASSATGDTKP